MRIFCTGILIGILLGMGLTTITPPADCTLTSEVE